MAYAGAPQTDTVVFFSTSIKTIVISGFDGNKSEIFILITKQLLYLLY